MQIQLPAEETHVCFARLKMCGGGEGAGPIVDKRRSTVGKEDREDDGDETRAGEGRRDTKSPGVTPGQV